MQTKLNFILVRLLIGSVITFVAGTVAAQTSADKQWKVKYDSGTETLKKGEKVTVIVHSDKIAGQPEKGQSFSIPVSAITEVSYDTIEKKRTKQGAALMVASPLAGLILMGTKTTRHYVTIVSKENEQDKDISFEVGKDDHIAFLAELQRVTGHPWRDRGAERRKTETELDHQKKQNISIQLDRKAGVNGVALKPGVYQIVLLERPDNKGEIYFFAGKSVDPKKSIAMSPVDIAPQTGGPTTAQVKYEDTNGQAMVTEIQTPSKTFRLRNE